MEAIIKLNKEYKINIINITSGFTLIFDQKRLLSSNLELDQVI